MVSMQNPVRVRIYYTNYKQDKSRREHIGTMVISSDYSAKIDTQMPGLNKKISLYLAKIVERGEVLFRFEEMKDGKFIMYGKMIKKGDTNFIYGLVNTLEKEINYLPDKDCTNPDEHLFFEIQY